MKSSAVYVQSHLVASGGTANGMLRASGGSLRSEDNTPLAERYLVVEARVSASSLDLVRKGLAPHLSGDWYFVSYSYADLPLPKVFTFLFPHGQPEAAVRTALVVVGCTQQFGAPWDAIPHGWKTICYFEYPGEVPPLIRGLPTADSWGSDRMHALCLSNHDAVDALLEMGRAR